MVKRRIVNERKKLLTKEEGDIYIYIYMYVYKRYFRIKLGQKILPQHPLN